MSFRISAPEIKYTTLQSYSNHAKEYISKDQADNVRTLAYWPGVQYFLNQLSKGQRILEIGSGTGTDALRIESEGYKVQRSDIVEAFLQHMRASGYDALFYDVEHGPYPQKQTAIFANAVLLHFPTEQCQVAFNNIQASLMNNGLFCLGMKLGDFEGWRYKGLGGRRYFKFWQLNHLQTHLGNSGFKVIHSFVTPSKDYTFITAKKCNQKSA